MSCKCKGCETQQYYDQARRKTQGCECNNSVFSVTVTIDDGKVKSGHFKNLDYYQAYNILSEYFNIELSNGDSCICD